MEYEMYQGKRYSLSNYKVEKENPDEAQINELLVQIKENIKDITYSLDKQFVKDGIDKIFEEAKML